MNMKGKKFQINIIGKMLKNIDNTKILKAEKEKKISSDFIAGIIEAKGSIINFKVLNKNNLPIQNVFSQ